MTAPDSWPANEPLPDLAAVAKGAALLDDYRLDELIAVYDARHRVAAAHHLPGVAETWGEAVLVLDGVRRDRLRVREEFAEMLESDAELWHLDGLPVDEPPC